MTKAVPIAVFLLIASQSASAGVWIRIGGITWHQKPGYNSDNPGFGIQYNWQNNFWAVGAYQNSYRKQSHYAIIGRKLIVSAPFSAGLLVGFVDNYPRFDGRLAPMAAPFVSIEGYGMGADLVALPPAVKKDGWALSLQGRISLGL